MSEFLIIDQKKCIGCGRCLADCSTRLFVFTEKGQPPKIKDNAEEVCIRCGHCLCSCPQGAIVLDGMTADAVMAVNEEKIPSFDQLMELVKYRRSIRNYKKDPVSQEDLNRLFDLVHWAPTAKNMLQLKWCVVNGYDKVHEIAQIIADGLRGDDSCARIVETWDNGYDGILRDAPCLAFAYTDESSKWTMTDGALAAEIMELGAAALGIGACWAGLFMVFAPKNKILYEKLGLKPGDQIGGALMLGYPAGEKYTKAPFRPQCEVHFIQ